ncbi:MAG: hypothetical protein BGO25_10405 [Acidobacteriales bacterium 59-55]|nr:AAA family ATPase [Terriglobales bacterium]OJV43595.1 MAG: hypothetical protein BGO25_10405 [Acidobacteriales bacterium 59-55]
MLAALLLEGGESTYNDGVGDVQESATLTNASEQYWAQQQTQLSRVLTGLQEETSQSNAEEVWKNFCPKGTLFLDRLLRKAIDRCESPLRSYWKNNKAIAREAIQLFRQGANIHLLLPFSGTPLRFLRVAPGAHDLVIDATGVFDHSQSIQIGRPYITVSYGSDCLFAITPTFGYMEMKTFFMDNPASGRWSSDHVFPSVFADLSRGFAAELNAVESQFGPLLTLWTQKELSNQYLLSLRRMATAAAAWTHICLPETQKLELLRSLELFERGDAAAPHGLLLTGSPGVGKSLIGKTIADTMGCSFQPLTPTSLKMDHLGGSGQKVHETWEKARREQPSILYLDECEGVLGRRGAAETDALSTEIVQAFLSEWDGLSKTDRVLVIGATNRRDLLDDAILSRFGWEMQIKVPSEADRIRILEQELKSVGIDVSLPADFASRTQGMSGRDLQEVARTARRMAHPEFPTLEQISDAIVRLRKSGNINVPAQSRWESLVLDHKTLARLKVIGGLLRDAEKWSAEGISIPRNLLLEGPPGGGKTEIGRTLANESGLAFFSATTADLKANYLGQSGNRVKQVFERARAHAPCILFLDELDIVAPERSLGEDDPLTREIVGQLLQEVDGVEAHPEHVFLLGATNRPEAVDRAILSRFTERLRVPLPDHAARIRLLTILLTGKKLDFSMEDGARLLADLTEGRALSGRDLRSWVASAEQNALVRAFENGGPEQYVMMLDDFSSAS